MILFLGDSELYDFAYNIYPDISRDLPLFETDKLIVAEYSHNAISVIRQADEMGIPVIGILDGYRSVAEAFGADCIPLENCSEGKQELAVFDTSVSLHTGLGRVETICRGNPYTIDEEKMPPELDCIARAETGEIISFCKIDSSENIKVFAVNYYVNSTLTQCGNKVLENFLNL